MKKIKRVILRSLALILFVTIIKPIFITIKSMDIIDNPQVGDFYLVNRKKLKATEFAQDKKTIIGHGGYQIYQISNVTENEVTLKINGIVYSPYSYAIKSLNNGAAYAPEYYEDGKVVKLPRSELTKLNLLNIIKSAHRLNQDTIEYNIVLDQCRDTRFDKSKILINEVINSKLKPEEYEVLANCLYDKKQYSKAAVLYIKSAEYSVAKAKLFYNAGVSHSYAGNFIDAITYYLKAIKENPDFTATYGNLGLAYAKINDTKNALEYYDIAMSKEKPSKPLIANYIEAALIENVEINFDKILNQTDYLNDKSFKMKIAMLRIIFLSKSKDDVSEEISEWEKEFYGTKFNWDFDQLKIWAKSQKQKAMIDVFESNII